jgi:hypothetical protein
MSGHRAASPCLRLASLLIAGVVLCLAPAGCRHPSERAAEDLSFGAKDHSLGGVVNLDDPCTLLTNADVANVLHSLIVDASRPRTNLAAEYVDAASGHVTTRPERTCLVVSSSGDVLRPEAMKHVVFSITVGTSADYERERARARSRAAEALPGVAEQALWNGVAKTAAALKGGRAVLISGIPDRTAAADLLKRASGRLP